MGGYKIEAIREERGMTRTQLANAIGVPRATLGTWERGDRMCSLSQACAIADVLGCTLDELAGRDTPYVSVKNMGETQKREVQQFADYVRQREDS